MSVNAALFERENEPEFFARKCSRCHEPAEGCICEGERDDDLPSALPSSNQE